MVVEAEEELGGTVDGSSEGTHLVVSAFGIHTGGGLVLLHELLRHASGALRAAFLDLRVTSQFDLSNLVVEAVAPRLGTRLRALWAVSGVARQGDVLLCFNSLPPLRRSAARTITFVHAPYIAGLHKEVRYNVKTSLRFMIERLLFRFGLKNTDEIWVQTESMAQAMRSTAPKKLVRIVPFVELSIESEREKATKLRQSLKTSKYYHHTYFYPADGVAHKNHPNLLKAWHLLSEWNVAPRLELTLKSVEYKDVLDAAGFMAGELPTVHNLGPLPRNKVIEKFKSGHILIFPSLAETFGLPLLEAASAGTKIIGSERDFVRDVSDPVQTFDPTSAISIARAVARDLGVPAERPMLRSGYEFVRELIKAQSAANR